MLDDKWQVVKLLLLLGIQRHVFYYHDKSCFHGYNYKKTLQLDSITSQQKMPGKSKGKLIHVLNFIRLKGKIIMLDLDLDTRKIIFLRARGDLQQDTKQLLIQIEIALNIFKLKHPNYIIVLIFDQSFIHASYKEGALNAFNINLGNGGKKSTLKDIYYPLKCTILELRDTI